ncbi:MAG: SDR family oxidoreductase [Halieaceae bacterium]
MPSTLITGANRGLGLELVQQYAAQGWDVIACCREPGTAVALNDLASAHSGIEVHALDVSDAEAVVALAQFLTGRTIDLLILNAGVLGDDCASLGALTQDKLLRVMNINTVAPALMIQAFAEHVAAGDKKLIVGMSSILGSIAGNSDGGLYSYRASKAGLNAVLRSAAMDLRDRGITVLAMHPGWVQTDMGGEGAQITTEQSVTGMLQVIEGATNSDSGSFVTYDGSGLPW